MPKPTMKRSFYTVLLLRHDRPRFRKLSFSQPFLWFLGAVVAVASVAGLATPHLWLVTRNKDVEVERLRHENERLLAQRDLFEETLSGVTRRVEEFEEKAEHLARELGLPASAAPAAGGDGTIEMQGPRRGFMSDELLTLDARTQRLDVSMSKLGDLFEERSMKLAATPNSMPVEGWFSHGYGWRKDPFDGKREFHRGVDIVAAAGTEILSPADGVVSSAGRRGAYGNCIDISHGYGFVTRYAHLSKMLVQPGQKVRRGDVLGRVGSTGRSTGPHLHYEVIRDGRRVNPWKYLGR